VKYTGGHRPTFTSSWTASVVIDTVKITHFLTVTPVRSKEKLSRYHNLGAKGKRRYISNSFLTSALDRGECSASRPGCAIPPGKVPSVAIVQDTGWVSEPVWTQRLEGKSFVSAGERY
jgi:hypothetical protein